MIHGLTPRQSLQAVVTIGTKPASGSGSPIHRDRFYIKSPALNANDARDNHPLYRQFNEAAPEHRRLLFGNLVHASIADAAHWQLVGYRLPGLPQPPNGAPACSGDGKTASRWDGERFNAIACPNELCQYRQGEKKDCRPFMRLVFRLSFRSGKLPPAFAKVESRGWASVASLAGFVASIQSTAAAFGIANPNVFGLPLSIQLSEATNKAAKTRFPTLAIAHDCDLVEFFGSQRQRRTELSGDGQPVIEYETAATPGEPEAATIAALEPTP